MPGTGPQGKAAAEQRGMRLFIAVDIPSEAVACLTGWQQRFLATEKRLRLTPAEQLHVTLVFLGQMGEERADEVAGILQKAAGFEPFKVSATSMAGLPRGRRPRVVAAALDDPAGTLTAMHELLAAELASRYLFQPEERAFYPHVTLARARGAVRLKPENMTPEPCQFTAVRVSLYNSILKSEGAVHQALETVQLG